MHYLTDATTNPMQQTADHRLNTEDWQPARPVRGRPRDRLAMPQLQDPEYVGIFWVDIPTVEQIDDPEGSMKNVATFTTLGAALDFAKLHFGADDEGRVSLVSGG